MALWCPPRGELGLQQLAHALFRPSRSCVDLLRLAPANPIKLVDILHAQLRQIRFVADNGAWSPLASGAAPAAPVEGPGTTPGATLEEAVRPLIRRRRVAASVTRWGLTRVSVRRRCAALAVAERLDPRRRGGALLRDGGRAVRRRRQPPLLLARRRDALRPTWRPGQRVTSLAFERAPEAGWSYRDACTGPELRGRAAAAGRSISCCKRQRESLSVVGDAERKVRVADPT